LLITAGKSENPCPLPLLRCPTISAFGARWGSALKMPTHTHRMRGPWFPIDREGCADLRSLNPTLKVGEKLSVAVGHERFHDSSVDLPLLFTFRPRNARVYRSAPAEISPRRESRSNAVGLESRWRGQGHKFRECLPRSRGVEILGTLSPRACGSTPPRSILSWRVGTGKCSRNFRLGLLYSLNRGCRRCLS
jgi:hypothetical protein